MRGVRRGARLRARAGVVYILSTARNSSTPCGLHAASAVLVVVASRFAAADL